MIEIVHFKRRHRQVCAVFNTPDGYSSARNKTYAQRYAAGLEKPYYPSPSVYCFSLISNKVDVRACEINITDMMLGMLR